MNTDVILGISAIVAVGLLGGYGIYWRQRYKDYREVHKIEMDELKTGLKNAVNRLSERK